jgi:hypothetical protein
LRHYTKANEYYSRVRDTLGVARLSLSTSIAALFTRGLGPAIRFLQDAERGASLSAQLRDYIHVNRMMMLLLGSELEEFDRLAEGFRTQERWVELTMKENLAVRHWLGGDPGGAIGEMRRLIPAFEEIEDGWGAIDNRINIGCVQLAIGEQAEAARHLREGLELSRLRSYPLGGAVAAAGLRALGTADAPVDGEELYRNHLSPLFRNRGYLFVPCYTLLLP